MLKIQSQASQVTIIARLFLPLLFFQYRGLPSDGTNILKFHGYHTVEHVALHPPPILGRHYKT
jgi:hypothetical protein